MTGLRLLFALAGATLPLTIQAQASPSVTVVQGTSGGSIAYAPMPTQHTAQGAMGRVLTYVRSRYGGRPQIVRVLRGAQGNALAVTFTVKPASGEALAGLALVMVSPTAPGKGAVLVDQADRFRSTVKPLLQQLESIASGARPTSDSSPQSPAPIAPAAGSTTTATTTATPAKVAATPTHDSGSAPAKPAKLPPAEKLHTAQFPDGTGSIGLPDGWSITGAKLGEVIAQGPAPAGLHFNWQFNASDRAMGAGPNAPLVIPYGTEAGATFKAVLQQIVQRQHKAAPTLDVLFVGPVTDQEYFIVANGSMEGQAPMRTWAHLQIGARNSQGIYRITLYLINFAQENADQTQGTAVAMFSSFKVNNDVAIAQIQAATRQQQQWFQQQQADFHAREAAQDRQFADYQRRQDAQDRQFQAFDNGLLNNTVVFDKELNGHGTVSDDLADALVRADPNRFEVVTANDYVKGIDY